MGLGAHGRIRGVGNASFANRPVRGHCQRGKPPLPFGAGDADGDGPWTRRTPTNGWPRPQSRHVAPVAARQGPYPDPCHATPHAPRHPPFRRLAWGLLAACQRQNEAKEAETAATAPTPAASPAEPSETAAAPAKAAPTDLDKLADRVVTQSAGVKEGEIVLINGQPADGELLEDLAVSVRKAGGFPIVFYDTDRLDKRMFFDVPPKYDTQPDKATLGLMGLADAVINVADGTTENLFEGADPARVAARGKTGEAIGQAMLKRGVRTIELGNNLYPTPWRAQRYGMSVDGLSKLFWSGVNTDYAEVQTGATRSRRRSRRAAKCTSPIPMAPTSS